jgi:NAD(P)-dependent dehydrogenase (short-subunit alcohol dehydrogenase family)
MKKVIVTGHGTGIGKAIFDLLSNDNNVVGYCLSNGLDLTIPTVYDQFLAEMSSADIVINNAFSSNDKYLQTKVLNDFMDMHSQSSSKAILSLGSMSMYQTRSSTLFNRYASAKALLNDTLNRIISSPHKCGVMTVSPNWVRTPMYESYKQSNPTEVSLCPLEPEEIAKQVHRLLKLFFIEGINVYRCEIKRMQ